MADSINKNTLYVKNLLSKLKLSDYYLHLEWEIDEKLLK